MNNIVKELDMDDYSDIPEWLIETVKACREAHKKMQEEMEKGE